MVVLAVVAVVLAVVAVVLELVVVEPLSPLSALWAVKVVLVVELDEFDEDWLDLPLASGTLQPLRRCWSSIWRWISRSMFRRFRVSASRWAPSSAWSWS